MAVRASNTSGGGPASSPQQSQSQPAAGSQSSTAIPGFDDESMDILLEDYIAELTPEEFLRNGVSIDKKWRTDPAPKKPRTVTINQAKLEYVLPGAEEQYAADLEPVSWLPTIPHRTPLQPRDDHTSVPDWGYMCFSLSDVHSP
jgi:hypothetical protein